MVPGDVDAAARDELARLTGNAATPPREALRARLVLATLDGASSAEVAHEHGVSVPTVTLWRRRFEQDGVAGLRDRPRSGRPRLATATTRPGPPPAEGSNATADRLSDATLEMLLEAASRTIARRGFGATRVSDIARDAGVSPATIHYYFKTKDEILLRALLWANARLASHLEAIGSDGEDPLVSLARFIERTIPHAGIQRDEYLLEIDLWSRIRRHPELLSAWEGYANRWNAHLSALVRSGIERGRFRPLADPDEFVERLAAMTDGLAAQAAIGSKRMPPARAREIVLRYAADELGVEYELLERSAHLPGI